MLIPTLVCLLLADATAAYAKPDLLVEAAELKKKGSTDHFVVLDVRPRKAYLAGHIPGAVWIDLPQWNRLVIASAKPEAWAQRIGAVGIDGKKPVVVYDDEKNRDAARLWWILRYRGVPDVRLIQGGMPAYKAAGGSLSTEETAVHAVKPTLTPNGDRLLTRDQIMAGLKAGKLDQLIDARTSREHCGETTTAKRNGSIPTAKNLNWTDTLDAKTGRFKSAEDLRKLFKDAGIALDRPTATYCQSGGRAAVMAFVYELTTGKPARNYYRSWAEWGNNPDTPIVTPKKKD